MKRSKLGAIQFDELMYWIIGVVVLLVLIGFYFKLSGHMASAGEYMRNFLRFGA